MKIKNHHKAFSMLELVFVIVILGIVASIGSTIIAQLYDNYLTQRATQRVSTKTELAINQIVNRLTYRIGGSLIARNPAGGYLKLEDITMGATNKTNTILEWIGYDNDSFAAQNPPGWSGYADTNATASPNISTPGSGLNAVTTIVQNLSGGAPQLAAIFSLYGQIENTVTGDFSDADCYGYNGNTNCIHQVTVAGSNILTTDRAAATARISSHYKLAWSAYAIVPTDLADGTAMTDTLFDLELRYNYQPWSGIQYDNARTQKKVLLRNVTAFKFAESGGTVRIKLCATEKTGRKVNISVCKEKVVIR